MGHREEALRGHAGLPRQRVPTLKPALVFNLAGEISLNELRLLILGHRVVLRLWGWAIFYRRKERLRWADPLENLPCVFGLRQGRGGLAFG